MVSFVSRRYMRGENGSLVICLSQCLHLRNLYSVSPQFCCFQNTGAVVRLVQSNTENKMSKFLNYNYVEIQKSKNELFKMSYILICVGTF